MSLIKKDINECWCGSKDLEPFSSDYKKCNNCKTLINSPRPDDTFYEVHDDNNDFYGKEYWFERQQKVYGLPNIVERSRTDIYDRSIEWFRILMNYKLPPGKILEIGAGNGSFLSILKSAGFEASGIELSQWIVKFIQDTFGVKVYSDKIENLHFESKHFDVIAAFDVLEHLTNPDATLSEVSRVLKDDGIVILQTPCYPEPLNIKELERKDSKFLSMLMPTEHLYLFSEKGVELLLRKSGFKDVLILPGIFPYDMIIIASKNQLKRFTTQEIEDYLTTRMNNRTLLALLDLNFEWKSTGGKLKESEADRETRLGVINRLDSELKKKIEYIEEIEKDREARLQLIKKLDDELKDKNKHIEEIEKDREDRLKVINILKDEISKKEEYIKQLEKKWPYKVGKVLKIYK